MMLVVGLTGGIGMGKTTLANRFRDKGFPVFDADAAVHELYTGAAVQPIEAAFPGTTANGQVDRAKLFDALMADSNSWPKLEKIVHPLVREKERQFLRAAHETGVLAAVLVVPMLIETHAHKLVDLVVVASATDEKQMERVLSRPGMTEEKLKHVRRRQLTDAERRANADFVVDCNGTIEASQAQIDRVIESFVTKVPQAYEAFWA
jgi:dephospho-CoA kinase